MVIKGEMRGGINYKFGINIYTLLYIKQITNMDLLYSTGNSTQYFVMANMGIETKTVDICIAGLLCSTHVVNQMYSSKN